MKANLIWGFVCFLTVSASAQSNQVNKGCSIQSFLLMDWKDSCINGAPLGFQKNGFDGGGKFQLQFLDIFYRLGYLGISTPLLEIEKIQIDSNHLEYSKNYLFSGPFLIGYLGNYNHAEPILVFELLRKILWIPTLLSNFKIHLTDKRRYIGVYQGINSDFFLDNGFNFISKSQTGIEIGSGDGIYFTAGLTLNRVLFSSSETSKSPNSFGLSTKIWLAGW